MEKILIIERNILNPECCSFLKQKGYDVTKIDFSDAPTFNQRSFVNKYLNIFLRVVFQYKNYLYKAERKFNKKQRSKLVTQFCKKNTTQFDKVIAERQYSLVEKLYSENAWKNLLKNIYQKADSKQHCISNFTEDDFYNTENEIMLSKIDSCMISHFKYTEQLGFLKKIKILAQVYPKNKNVKYALTKTQIFNYIFEKHIN